MAESTQTSCEVNRGIAIIESLCVGRTPLEIINFFGYAMGGEGDF